MEITEIECKILRIKAGAILILGMQLGSELQLDTEEKREDVLMVLQNGMIRTLQINAWPILSIRKITAFFPNT